jgi:Rha family phage regulatory protein
MNQLVVSNKKGIYAESQVIANVFEKNHQHILRDIRELEKVCSKEFWQSNFGQSEYTVRGKKYPCYKLTKDGFTMLAMGFTGEKAIRFKEMYIAKFNEMERLLTSMALARLEFPALTDNIKQSHEEPKHYHYSNELNMLNKIVLGVSTKDFRKQNNIPDGESIRKYLTAEQLNDILELQRIDTGFVLAIPDYQDRKKMLESYYHRKRKLLLE